MINTPKSLSDIEVGLYRSGYVFCEKLVKEEHMKFLQCRFAEKLWMEHLISAGELNLPTQSVSSPRSSNLL